VIIQEVGRTAIGLAYLWEDNPPVGENNKEALPIYGKEDNFNLPAAPFKIELKGNVNKFQ